MTINWNKYALTHRELVSMDYELGVSSGSKTKTRKGEGNYSSIICPKIALVALLDSRMGKTIMMILPEARNRKEIMEAMGSLVRRLEYGAACLALVH